MDPLTLLPAGITITAGLVAGGVAATLLKERDPATEAAALRARKDAIIDQIRDLDSDRAKLDDAEWAAERERLIDEAAGALRSMDDLAGLVRSSTGGALIPPLAFSLLVGAFFVWALVAWPGIDGGVPVQDVAAARPANPHAPSAGMGAMGGMSRGSDPAMPMPDDIVALNAMTWQALTEGNLPVAMQANEKARTEHPDDTTAQVHRQVLRISVGMLPQAEAGLDEILIAHPDHPRALLFAAVVRADQGRTDEALPFLERLLRAAPDTPEASNAREMLAELSERSVEEAP